MKVKDFRIPILLTESVENEVFEFFGPPGNLSFWRQKLTALTSLWAESFKIAQKLKCILAMFSFHKHQHPFSLITRKSLANNEALKRVGLLLIIK